MTLVKVPDLMVFCNIYLIWAILGFSLVRGSRIWVVEPNTIRGVTHLFLHVGVTLGLGWKHQ
jgi:hypothetical protein